jgi:uncharacterized protein YbaP (TraB family)
MKINISLYQLAKMSFTPMLAVLLACSVPAMAYQTGQIAQNDIRYIDRSKGERNKAFPVSQTGQTDRTHITEKQTGSPLLWRIEHPDVYNGIRSSYIFGTIHLDDTRVMAIPDSVLKRLNVADTLMLELELNASGSVDMLRKMLFTDGRKLTQVIGETTFTEVSKALVESGNRLPGDVLTVLKPWAAMLLLVRPENKSGTFLDKRLAELARNAGIRVEGLETVNEQLSVFDDIAIDDQVSMLQSTMDLLTEKDLAYQHMIDAYLSGDLEKLVNISNSQQPKDKRLASLINTKLISERNQRMFERMQERIQAGNTFIAIGALHLPGEQGLLEKLRIAGYRLTRIERDE